VLTIYEAGGVQYALANTARWANTLKEIAELYKLMNQPQQAIETYQQALLIFNRNQRNPPFDLNVVQRDMNKVYQDMMRQQNKQP
jgi:tetratricopeptide (TPR) repeat protein